MQRYINSNYDFFITIRDLNINKYSTNKYAIVLMYFSNKNKTENFVKTLIIREIYLIDDIKANIFIKNDVLKFENFNIFILTFSISINNCDVIISISIKNRFSTKKILIHAIKSMIICCKQNKQFLYIEYRSLIDVTFLN